MLRGLPGSNAHSLLANQSTGRKPPASEYKETFGAGIPPNSCPAAIRFTTIQVPLFLPEQYHTTLGAILTTYDIHKDPVSKQGHILRSAQWRTADSAGLSTLFPKPLNKVF
ncbi:hypothetical protein STEG23_023517 [Scotinomys teguina]